MAIVFDIAVVVIVVLLVFLGYRRGFIRTVFQLVGYFAAAAAAYFLSMPIAGWIYNTFMRSASIDLLLNGLADMSENQSIQSVLNQAMTTVPQNILAFAPEGTVESVKAELLQSVPTHDEIATVIVDQLICPIATAIMQLLIFIILFLILCIVVKVITRMLKLVDKIPLVGTLNSTLGLAVGLAEAVVFLAFFTGVVAIIIQLSGNQWDAINQSVVEQTYLFKFLYEYNPLIQLK